MSANVPPTPDYHHIGFDGLQVANPVTMAAIEAFAERTGLPAGAKVLDIGAGTGGVSAALAGRFDYHVHAIERDPVMAGLIRDRVRRGGLEDRLTIVAEHSTEALDRLAPADMIVALGSTEAAGRGVKTPDGILGGLATHLGSSGYLLWGDLTWTKEPPVPLRQVMALSGIYASDQGWRKAAANAGMDCVLAEMSPQDVWDGFFDGVDARVREWMRANPRAAGLDKLKLRADQVKSVFAFGRPYLGFGLYLFRKT